MCHRTAPSGLMIVGRAVAAVLMRRLRPVLVLASLCVLSPGLGRAGEAPPLAPAVISALEAGGLGGWLVLPAGRTTGLVVLLPDGDGADPRSAAYVEQLLGAGLAVFDVQRGEAEPGAVASGLAALPAASGLAGLPIGVLGFGAGARQALALGGDIAARVLLYPGCAAATEATATDPVLVLHGEGDLGNTVEQCTDLADRLSRAGRPVRRIGYAQAGYAWDYPAHGLERRILLRHPDGQGRVAAEPWAALTAFSASQVAAFFAASLGGGTR